MGLGLLASQGTIRFGERALPVEIKTAQPGYVHISIWRAPVARRGTICFGDRVVLAEARKALLRHVQILKWRTPSVVEAKIII